MFIGHALITGLSLINTLNAHEELPHEFEALHVTIVIPAANEVPEAGLQVTVAAGEPVADGVV